VLPGTVYNFDPGASPPPARAGRAGNTTTLVEQTDPQPAARPVTAGIAEDAPQRSSNPKGRIRIAMEQRLESASRGGLRVLILRAGDFFGPPPSNSWLTEVMAPGVRPLRRVVYPGVREAGRAWAYLPDLGETLARLLDQEDRLGGFARFHFGGHWLSPGVQMAEAVRRVVGDPGLPIRPFPWLVIRALAPFNETFQGLVETSYLWRQPLRLDNARLVAFLGAEPHTPLDEAVRASLPGLAALASKPARGPVRRTMMA
jgi:nucleoside-diphosphate-sugar epimerase